MSTQTTVLMNDFQRQWQEIGKQVLEATRTVGESGWYVLGSAVKQFEQNLASQWQLPHVIGCANGLDAIEIGLRVLGIKPGDKVLTTPLSAFATTLAIMRCGGIPVFVDVDSRGLLDLLIAEQALQADPSIRFMVPVHLYGHALCLRTLKRLREQYSLQIVEDCAQAIGARSGGQPVGSIGQMAATSFYPTKNLGAMGDGGAVICNDAELALKARCLRDYGQSQKYLHSEFGLNSRLDELHAAILDVAMLPKLGSWTRRRQEIALRYIDGIKHPKVRLPSKPEDSDSVWHLFPLIVDSQREQLQACLAAAGIHSGVHYPILITSQPALLALGQPQIFGALNNAQRYATHELSIPIHPYLNDDEVTRVIDAINTWSTAA
jgi:dTDP-3-amino-3,4,6-trideoxy-alpha-D-glucose transaminase